MSEQPWWNPTEADLVGWDRPLPEFVRLAPDYGVRAPLVPLWGNGFGNVSWQFTKLSPELLDRLVEWQEMFDDNFDTEGGWASEFIRDAWTARTQPLADDLQAALGRRARVLLDLSALDRRD
jgi:hypothetical protein